MQKKWVLFSMLALITFFLIIISLDNNIIENHYSLGIYPFISTIFRWLTGWVSISIGDMLYLAAGCYLAYLFVRGIGMAFKKKLGRRMLYRWLSRSMACIVIIYILFNIFWGLNYDRKGLVYQFDLDTAKYSTADLLQLQSIIIRCLNESKRNLVDQKNDYPTNTDVFKRASGCFTSAAAKQSFLSYKIPSVKPSLYSWWCSYAGVSGYYNPFSGEAQVNTDMPKFILPFTTCHEIAHQLGYATENEANFAGFITAASSNDALFNYSAYLDVFFYANRELYFTDTLLAKQSFAQLDTLVKKDIKEYRNFILKHSNIAEPIITWLYGKYLKANQQPKGLKTYSEVIVYLIAYYKKYGKLTL